MSEPVEHELDLIWRKRILIEPVTGENLNLAVHAAKLDNHALLAPTDIVTKNGEVVGALEINSVPQVLVWMHTQKTNIRDSIEMLNFVRGVMGRFQMPNFILPCSVKSPYHSYLSKIGFANLGDFTLFSTKK